MKIEIGKDFPQCFIPSYPEEFKLFSHFETTARIPTVLLAIIKRTESLTYAFTHGVVFMAIR